MKQTFLFLFACLFGVAGIIYADDGSQTALSPALRSAETSSRNVQADWQLEPPVVDGDLSEWDRVEKLYLNGNTADAPANSYLFSPQDLSGWLSVLWSQDRVYLAFSVQDEYVVRNSRSVYQDDMLSVVFDVDQSGDLSFGDVIVTMSPDGIVTANSGWPAGYESAIFRDGNGWFGEISMPMTEFGNIDFLGDLEVGFTWGIQDDDGMGVESWLSWAGEDYLQPTPREGRLSFVHGPVRKWVAFHPGQGGYDGIVDASLDGWHPDENDGDAPVVHLYARNQYHMVLKFDIPDLGPNVRVLDGRLHLNIANRNHDWEAEVRVYPLLRPWEESVVTWKRATADALWQRPGADAVGVDRSDRPVSQGTLDQLGWITFDLDDAFVRDIAQHPDANYGLIFRAEEGAYVRYDISSSESGPDTAPWIEIYAEFPPGQVP